MLIFKTQNELVSHLQSLSISESSVGFVPTMGALHRGHLSLLERAFKENTTVVISIFVNPTQFNNAEDLAKYPRTFDEDIAKIKTISNNTIVFAPTVEDIYEGQTISQHFDFDGLENQMEGQFRPGHFDGVGTIVKRLFEIVNPTRAYFGEKDFQQLQIIRKMVSKLQLPVAIVECPIYRESNGLAMSSRNERLTTKEREDSSVIYSTLTAVKNQFEYKSAQELILWVSHQFDLHPQFKLEYFQIAEEETLLPCVTRNKNKKYRAFIAVFINNIRLIDTISLN